MKLDLGIPVINLEGLNGEKKEETMALLHEACEKWASFSIDEKAKGTSELHYEKYMKERSYKSETAKGFLEESPAQSNATNVDWECTFFVHHLPTSNINDFTSLAYELRKAMEEHINQVIKSAERLLELMPENLGLDRDYLKKQFSGEKGGPSVGTKVAKYPQYPLLELVNGLRAHTGASGIILLLQDDQIPGLQVLKDGEWMDIITAPYSEGKSIICINTGDQIEVMSNGRYKRTLHRVLTNKEGSRLSIATFYNLAADALISPAPDLLYPSRFGFQDYLDLYVTIKFADKGPRFQTMKKMSLSGPSLHV